MGLSLTILRTIVFDTLNQDTNSSENCLDFYLDVNSNVFKSINQVSSKRKCVGGEKELKNGFHLNYIFTDF
jgi:hypothetical protein